MSQGNPSATAAVKANKELSFSNWIVKLNCSLNSAGSQVGVSRVSLMFASRIQEKKENGLREQLLIRPDFSQPPCRSAETNSFIGKQTDSSNTSVYSFRTKIIDEVKNKDTLTWPAKIPASQNQFPSTHMSHLSKETKIQQRQLGFYLDSSLFLNKVRRV